MIEPVEYKHRATKLTLCAADCETDPFKEGRPVKPFTCGFYDGETYVDFWGVDCIAQLFAYIKANYLPNSLMIYWHNGGKFDFFFCLDHMDPGQFPSIINGRLTKLMLGGQENRDSFAALPVPLAKFGKDEIDYSLMEADKRERHRVAILKYQKRDVLSLYAAIVRFHEMFGDKLTIGSAALPMLKSYHGFETLGERDDTFLRQFYFGGRVQAFEIGELRGRWKVYDRNSMYPAVMANYLHPVGREYIVRRDLSDKATFAKIDAKNYGALPARTEDGGLSFDVERGTFFATIHEINAGLETGTLQVERVHFSLAFPKRTTFADFVTAFFDKRAQAKLDGDEMLDIFYKLILNSSYGKFAQDPSKYQDFALTAGGLPADERGLWGVDNPKGWKLDAIHGGKVQIWKADAENPSRAYKNVATAASITGGSRADLLRALAKATRPVYCDTDSVICEAFAGDAGKALGQWKLEAEGDRVAIGGKKIYAVFDGAREVKSACKGADLDAEDVAAIARGETIEWTSQVPNFKRDTTKGREYGRQEFITRKIRATGKRVLHGPRHVAKKGRAK